MTRSAVARPSLGRPDGKDKKIGSVARGGVFGVGWTMLFERLGLKPILQREQAGVNFRIQYLHRRTSEADIYFVSNQMGRVREFVATFRVSGRVPELWDAETGERHDAPSYRFVDGMTEVPLRLDQSGSVFVVFRRPAFGDKVVDVALCSRPFWGRGQPAFVRKAGTAPLTGMAGWT